MTCNYTVRLTNTFFCNWENTLCTWQCGMLRVKWCHRLCVIGAEMQSESLLALKYSLTLQSSQVTPSNKNLGPAVDQRSPTDVLTPWVTELVHVASPISSAHNFCMLFYPQWTLTVPFMAAGKACLPVNYLTDEIFAIQIHLSGSYDFCSSPLDAPLPFFRASLQPTPGV